MITSPRILVVDDEEPIRSLSERLLRGTGIKVFSAATAAEGMRILQEETLHLVVLDLNLPDGSGEALCREIRQNPKTQGLPILIFTAQLRDGLSVQCLDNGADDYLNKPFDVKEFVARVRALLRRPPVFVSDDSILTAGPVSVCAAERRICVHGRTVPDFSPKEYGLLFELILQAPKVLNKERLAQIVWGVSIAELNTRTLDVHIRRIRKKLGPAGIASLKTIPAIGYQWIHAVKKSLAPTPLAT